MKTIGKDAAAAPVAAAPGADAAPGASSRDRIRAISQVCRQVFGIPDYARYLERRALYHAGEPVLSRREFFARAIDAKYGKSGPRCC